MPLEDQARYRNQKGTLLQNVLAVCDFDMRFVYIFLGQEGSAHDGKVVLDTQACYRFNTLKGKFWLSNTSYGNSEYIIALYRGV